MRLLLTADTVGGVWTFALELCRALGPHGVGIDLATMGGPLSPAQRAEVRPLLAHVSLHESAFKLEWMDDPWSDVGCAGQWLLALAARVRPDVVHLNGTLCHGALPFNAPVLAVGHSCVLSWWQAVKGECAPPSWEAYRHAAARGLRAADLVVAPTGAMLAALSEHYGPFHQTGVIPNSRDARLFPTVGVKEPFVLVAGRLWDEAKNIAALVEVAPRLPWPVRIAGEARRPGQTHVVPQHAAAPVCWLGPLAPPDLAAQLSRAAIYALPARYEPFGLSALEAGLAGCALVLGDIPSLREVWGDAALFVDPDDPAALETTLKTLMTDESLRDTLAQRARARALLYTPKRLAASYLEAYQGLLKDSRPAASPPANPPSLPPNPPSLGGEDCVGRTSPAGRDLPAGRDSGAEQATALIPTHSSPPKLGGRGRRGQSA